jgi:tetratricopeptide (TPR) repeat protein
MLVEVEADPALRNDPDISGAVWWNLASVLYETSDYGGAGAAFESALSFHPQNEPNHYKILLSLGDCYLGTTAYAKARECYEKVVASAYSWDAEKLKACAGVAKALYETGEYTQAASAFETVLSDYRNDDPDYYNLLLWLGGCYEEMRNIVKARDSYERVVTAPCALKTDKVSAQEALMRLMSSGRSQVYH